MKLLLSIAAASAATIWDTQETWGGHCQEVNTQSPVDIHSTSKDKTIKRKNWDRYFPKEGLQYSGNTVGELTATNEGTHIHLAPTHATDFDNFAVHAGGLLFCDYHFEEIDIYQDGSNHKVNDDRSTAELILGFHKDAACTHPRAQQHLHVSILMESGSTNDAITPVSDAAGSLTNVGDNADLGTVTLTDLFPKNFLDDYYIYEGSHILPPCDPDVTWIINRYKKNAHKDQWKALRTLLGEDGLPVKDNYRQEIKLGARAAFKTFGSSGSSSGFGGGMGGMGGFFG